ncbi:hypothetical protein Tco_0291794 [Tanacetum coccineum]
MCNADINTLTMEKYLVLTRGNQAPGVVKLEIGGNVNFEIKSPFNGGNCPGCSSVGSRNDFVYDPNPYSYNETPDFFNQPPQHQYETYSLPEQFCCCEICGVTPPAYSSSLPFLATMEPTYTLLMGDEVISTILAREINEFIKSSVDDLVPIPRESEVTLDSNYECDMPTPLPTTDVREDKFDISLPLG